VVSVSLLCKITHSKNLFKRYMGQIIVNLNELVKWLERIQIIIITNRTLFSSPYIAASDQSIISSNGRTQSSESIIGIQIERRDSRKLLEYYIGICIYFGGFFTEKSQDVVHVVSSKMLNWTLMQHNPIFVNNDVKLKIFVWDEYLLILLLY
jgi:hypothetical protein